MLSTINIYFFNSLSVFRIHNTVTPTSANTASHIFDIPKSDNAITSAPFIPSPTNDTTVFFYNIICLILIMIKK